MAYLNDFGERFRLGLPSATPFKELSRSWCVPCAMDVDCVADIQNKGTTYLFKRCCKRCGGVIQHGVYQNVPLVNVRALSPDVLRWTKEGIRR